MEKLCTQTSQFFSSSFSFPFSYEPDYSGGVIHVLQPVLSHTLLQEALAVVARLGAHEITAVLTLAETHNVHVCATQQIGITELLDDIFLSVNRTLRISRPATASANAVSRLGNDLAALDKNGKMDLSAVSKLHLYGTLVGDKAGKNINAAHFRHTIDVH